jgi:hypothetical protein
MTDPAPRPNGLRDDALCDLSDEDVTSLGLTGRCPFWGTLGCVGCVRGEEWWGRVDCTMNCATCGDRTLCPCGNNGV